MMIIKMNQVVGGITYRPYARYCRCFHYGQIVVLEYASEWNLHTAARGLER